MQIHHNAVYINRPVRDADTSDYNLYVNGSSNITGNLKLDGSITNLAVNGGIYWNPYVESASDASDAASITVVKSGVAGGTELRISQANDPDDIVNISVPTNDAARINNNIILNAANYTNYAAASSHSHNYLPLSGGTLTGTLALGNGANLDLRPPSSGNDSGDIVFYYSNGNEKMRIWSNNDYSGYCGPNFRLYKEDGTYLGGSHL